MTSPEPGELIFVKEDGRPMKFFLFNHDRWQSGARNAIKDSVEQHGGEMSDVDVGCDVILVNPHLASAPETVRQAYKTHSDPQVRSARVESAGWVKSCISTRQCVHFFEQKPMGGVPVGYGRSRVEFTREDDERLAHYLAITIPHKDSGGRTGNNIYKNLIENAHTIPDEYFWALRHTWQSWRERYKMNQALFDQRINALLPVLDPQPHQQYELSRYAPKYGKREAPVYEEEEEEEVVSLFGDDEEQVVTDSKPLVAPQLLQSHKRRAFGPAVTDRDKKRMRIGSLPLKVSQKGKEKLMPDEYAPKYGKGEAPVYEEVVDLSGDDVETDAMSFPDFQLQANRKRRAFLLAAAERDRKRMQIGSLSLKASEKGKEKLMPDEDNPSDSENSLFDGDFDLTMAEPAPAAQIPLSSQMTLVEPGPSLQAMRIPDASPVAPASPMRSEAPPVQAETPALPEGPIYRLTRARSRSQSLEPFVDDPNVLMRKKGKKRAPALAPVHEDPFVIEETQGSTVDGNLDTQAVEDLLLDTSASDMSSANSIPIAARSESPELMPPPRQPIRPAIPQSPDDARTHGLLRQSRASTASHRTQASIQDIRRRLGTPRLSSASTRTTPFPTHQHSSPNARFATPAGGPRNISRTDSETSGESFPLSGTRASAKKQEMKREEMRTPYRAPLNTRAAALTR